MVRRLPRYLGTLLGAAALLLVSAAPRSTRPDRATAGNPRSGAHPAARSAHARDVA